MAIVEDEKPTPAPESEQPSPKEPEERIDPETGEILPPEEPGPLADPESFEDLATEADPLPAEMTQQSQPMAPETATALAQAGYELQVSGPAGTDEEVPSRPSGDAFDQTSETEAPNLTSASKEAAPQTPSDEMTEPQTEELEGPKEPHEDKQEGKEETPTEGPDASTRVGLFKVLLARETLPHFGILALFMLVFLALTFSKDESSGDLMVALGLGGPLAFLVAALLALTPLVQYVRHQKYGWAIPLVLAIIFSLVIRHFLLAGSENADENRKFFSMGFAGLFVIWQFLQAWWMRVPFENWASRRYEQELEEEDDWGTGPVAAVDKWATRLAGKGTALNGVAPVIWALVGLGLFELLYRYEIFVPEEGARFEAYDTTFQAAWLATMFLMGVFLTLLIRRMLRWAPDSGRVAILSGAFAFGFWTFLAYHGFALFWSLGQAPSFAFDLIFMLITILVAIYSLSSKAVSNVGGLIRPENVLFFGIFFGISYSAANFFLISDFSGFGKGIEPRTVGQLSHLVAALFGALVLLMVNVGFLYREGHLHHGGLSGLMKALSKPYPPMKENTLPAPDKDTEASSDIGENELEGEKEIESQEDPGTEV